MRQLSGMLRWVPRTLARSWEWALLTILSTLLFIFFLTLLEVIAFNERASRLAGDAETARRVLLAADDARDTYSTYEINESLRATSAVQLALSLDRLNAAMAQLMKIDPTLVKRDTTNDAQRAKARLDDVINTGRGLREQFKVYNPSFGVAVALQRLDESIVYLEQVVLNNRDYDEASEGGESLPVGVEQPEQGRVSAKDPSPSPGAARAWNAYELSGEALMTVLARGLEGLRYNAGALLVAVNRLEEGPHSDEETIRDLADGVENFIAITEDIGDNIKRSQEEIAQVEVGSLQELQSYDVETKRRYYQVLKESVSGVRGAFNEIEGLLVDLNTLPEARFLLAEIRPFEAYLTHLDRVLIPGDMKGKDACRDDVALGAEAEGASLVLADAKGAGEGVDAAVSSVVAPGNTNGKAATDCPSPIDIRALLVPLRPTIDWLVNHLSRVDQGFADAREVSLRIDGLEGQLRQLREFKVVPDPISIPDQDQPRPVDAQTEFDGVRGRLAVAVASLNEAFLPRPPFSPLVRAFGDDPSRNEKALAIWTEYRALTTPWPLWEWFTNWRLSMWLGLDEVRSTSGYLVLLGYQSLEALFVLTMGAIGSMIYIVKDKLDREKGRDTAESGGHRLMRSLFRLFFGAMVAFAIYLLYRSGQLALGGGSEEGALTGSINLPIVSITALIAGLLAEQALNFVETQGEALIRRGGGRRDGAGREERAPEG